MTAPPLLSAAGAVGAAILAMPALLLHPGAVLATITAQERAYEELSSPPLWRQLLVRA